MTNARTARATSEPPPNTRRTGRARRLLGRVVRWALVGSVIVFALIGFLFVTRGTVVRQVRGVVADGSPVAPAEPEFPLSVAVLTGTALSNGNREEIALDGERLARALEEGMYARGVRADFRSGVRSGVNGTPTFFVNGARYDGAWADADEFLHVLRTAAEA